MRKKYFLKKIYLTTPGARSRDVFLPGSPDGAEIVWKRGTDGPYYKVSTNIYKYLNISLISRCIYNIYLTPGWSVGERHLGGSGRGALLREAGARHQA